MNNKPKNLWQEAEEQIGFPALMMITSFFGLAAIGGVLSILSPREDLKTKMPGYKVNQVEDFSVGKNTYQKIYTWDENKDGKVDGLGYDIREATWYSNNWTGSKSYNARKMNSQIIELASRKAIDGKELSDAINKETIRLKSLENQR